MKIKENKNDKIYKTYRQFFTNLSGKPMARLLFQHTLKTRIKELIDETEVKDRKIPREEDKKFLKNLDGKIYYIKIKTEGRVFYKIGFTTRGIVERLCELGLKQHELELLQVLRFKDGFLCWKIEQVLHGIFSNLKANMIIINSGNSEVYVKDVLGLDTCGRYVETAWYHEHVYNREERTGRMLKEALANPEDYKKKIKRSKKVFSKRKNA